MGTCRVTKVHAANYTLVKVRTRCFSATGCVQEAALRLLHASRGHTTVTHPPFPVVPQGRETALSSLFILSTEGAAPLRHLRGSGSRAPSFHRERTAPTLNNLDRNLHASQDVTDNTDTCDRTVLINRRNLYRGLASIASRFRLSRAFTVTGN